MAQASRRKRRRASRSVKQGLPPGAPIYVGELRDDPIHVEVLDYDQARLTELRACSAAELARLASAASVTWVNIDGLHNAKLVDETARAFNVHPLWIEDLLNATARPKVERIGSQLLVIARALSIAEEADSAVEAELNGFVLGPGWLLALQERPGDQWDPVRKRLREGEGELRRARSDLLLHALLDAVVDHYFIVLERLESRVEEMEDAALSPRERRLPLRFLAIKSDISVLRAAILPLREGVGAIMRFDQEAVTAESRLLWQDLADHLAQAQDLTDNLRERMVNALNIHLAVANQALNEVMRVLALVSTLFIPLTFIVGVYGMNFEYMPELALPCGYPAVLAVMFVVFVSMLAWFRRKGWF